MAQIGYLFLTHNPKRGPGIDGAFARTAALSHAATVGHQKRRASRAKAQTKHADDEFVLLAAEEKRRRDASNQVTATSGLLTILQKGNSDAFNSTAMRITPEMNDIMVFLKGYFLPASYGTESPAWIRPFGADKEWDDSVACLNDQCSGLAFVLTYATIIARLSQSRENTVKLLTLKRESFSTLQYRLSRSRSGDNNVLTCVLFLFAAETFAGNLFEAIFHGKTLRKLLEQKADREGAASIEPGFLTRAIWYDVHLAESQMVRTIFDVDGWVTDMLEPTFKRTDDFLASLSIDFTEGLDSGPLSHEPLRTVILQYRQALWLWTQPNAVSGEDGFSASHWVLGHSYINQGRLVNYHLDTQKRLKTTFVASTNSELLWQTQSCLAIGLLLFLAQFGGDPQISGTPLLPTVQNLMYHLRTVLGSALRAYGDLDPNAEITRGSHNVLLWTAYQGAHYERKDPKTYPDPSTEWFNQTLADFAQRIQLRTWPMIRERLEKVIYSDWVQPHGFDWVGKLISGADFPRKEAVIPEAVDGDRTHGIS